MLSIDTIARVTLTTGHTSAPSAAYDTGLILVRLPSSASSSSSSSDASQDDYRLQTFESAEAAVAFLRSLSLAETSSPIQTVRKYFGAPPAPSSLLLSCFPSAETPSEALAAVLARTPAFYGLCPGQDETPEALLALAAAVEAADHPMILFLPVTGTPAEAAAAGALPSLLKAASRARAFPFYSPDPTDIGAVLGTAMGLTLSHPDSAFSLCYKPVSGITPSDLTASEAAAFRALFCNAYLTRGYTHHLLELGTLSDGARYDERLYLDRIAADLQTAAVALLAENPDRLPQTDDASAQFINRFAAILLSYTGMGVLAPAAWRGPSAGPLSAGDTLENGFALWADPYDAQSEADRAAHRAMPIHVALTLAGSLESVTIAINVQL